MSLEQTVSPNFSFLLQWENSVLSLITDRAHELGSAWGVYLLKIQDAHASILVLPICGYG